MEKRYEDFLNSLSADEREKILNSAEKIKKKIELRENAKRNILETPTYITWLVNFLKLYPCFSTDDWLYNPNEISKEDLKNVQDLEFLFDIISEYATKNYIYLISTDFGGYYLIKFNDIGFKVGVAAGQGTVFTCEKIDIDNCNFLDFNLVMKDEELPTTKEIRSKLSNLKEQIKNLKKTVPKTAIQNELLDIIRDISIL